MSLGMTQHTSVCACVCTAIAQLKYWPGLSRSIRAELIQHSTAQRERIKDWTHSHVHRRTRTYTHIFSSQVPLKHAHSHGHYLSLQTHFDTHDYRNC